MELGQNFTRTTITSTDGAGTVVLRAGASGQVNRLHALTLSSSGGTFMIEGSTGSSTGAGYTQLTGVIPLGDGIPLVIPFDARREGVPATISGSALNLVSTDIGFDGYAITSQSTA